MVRNARLWLLVACIALAGALLTSARSERQGRFEQSGVAAEMMAVSLAENARMATERVDRVLLSLRTAWLERPGNFADYLAAHTDDLAGLPLRVTVADVNGFTVFQQPGQPGDQRFVGDQSFFQIHQGTLADRLAVTGLRTLQAGSQQGLQVSRPLRLDGKFAGAITLTVPLAALVRGLDGSESFGGASVLLLGRSDQVIDVLPSVAGIHGKALTLPDSVRRDAVGRGHGIGSLPLDDAEHAVGYASIPSVGLTVAVSMPNGDSLWFGERVTALALLAVAALLLVGQALISVLRSRQQLSQRLLNAAEIFQGGLLPERPESAVRDRAAPLTTQPSANAESLQGAPRRARRFDPAVVSDRRLTGLNILVCEGNDADRFILEEVLRVEGAFVSAVGTERQLLELLGKSRPGRFDLAFVDIEFPGESKGNAGLLVGRALPRLPLIGLADPDAEVPWLGLQNLGISQALARPVDTELLVAAVRRQLSRTGSDSLRKV